MAEPSEFNMELNQPYERAEVIRQNRRWVAPQVRQAFAIVGLEPLVISLIETHTRTCRERGEGPSGWLIGLRLARLDIARIKAIDSP